MRRRLLIAFIITITIVPLKAHAVWDFEIFKEKTVRGYIFIGKERPAYISTYQRLEILSRKDF